MSSNSEFLRYIPNDIKPGHRGDSAVENHNSLETLTSHAKALEEHGWKGVLIGTGWGQPDTFAVAASLAARTTTFEPLDGVRERIERLKALSGELERDLPPLEFGLRITTLVRDTTEEAWADAEAKVAEMAKAKGAGWNDHKRAVAVGQRRLLDLHERGEVLDDNLYTAPGKFGGGGAGTTWLVGSAADVARSLRKYRDLGITHFVLSDTPYLSEIRRQGDQLLPLLR
ncbi:LLM class flavin-dependent oxidoreductase [Rhizobium binxianense]